MKDSRTNGDVFITDHDYRFGLAAFVFVDEEILKGETKKKLNDDHYDRNKPVQILRDGDWIDTELHRSLHRWLQMIISRISPKAEHFLICMNEYNEENMRNWLTLQKSKPKEDLIKEFENPTPEYLHLKNNKAKKTLTEYFTNLSLLGLKPYFIEKSNEKLLHPFGKSFRLKTDKFTHPNSLAEKYKKMFEEIYSSPGIYNKRVNMANKIVKILNDESILGVERIMKLGQLFPIESIVTT